MSMYACGLAVTAGSGACSSPACPTEKGPRTDLAGGVSGAVSEVGAAFESHRGEASPRLDL